MSRFDSLEVSDIRKETPDCVSVSFRVPEELKEKFVFKPGQYLTVKTTLNGDEVRRSYSICSAPYEKDLRVAIKKVEGGAFSTFANETLQVGQFLDLMKPTGRFVSKFDEDGNNYLFFAAGSGITPVISIIKHILKTQPKSEISMIYGNRGFEHIIFRETIEALKNSYMNRFRVYHVLSREFQGESLYNVRIDEKKCIDFINSPIIDIQHYDEFFVCGPEEMINAVRSTLKSANVEDEKVRFELFTSPGQLKSEEKTLQKGTDSVGSDVTVIIDGVEHNFKLANDGLAILDAANTIGADLPFACKGGVCCTCRAKLVEGEVKMDTNYSLEEDELEQGFILTCQSHPVTDKIIVNFDIV